MRIRDGQLVAIVLCAITAGASSETSAQRTPVFRSGTNVVHIEVSIRRHHAPVLHLTGEDFDVRDKGVRQSIEALSSDRIPLDISLIFDRSTFGPVAALFDKNLNEMIAVMGPADRVQVITFATGVREIIAMQSAGELQLPKLDRSRIYLYLQHAGRETNAELDFMHDPRQNRRSLFDAILFGLARPAEVDRPHLVIVFALGTNRGGVLGDGTLLDQVAARSDAVLHAALWKPRIRGNEIVGLGSLYDGMVIRTAAEATGGAVHDATNGVRAFKSIVEEFRQGYVLQYTATGVPLHGWHDVTVTVPGHPDYEIHARKGYMGQ